MFLAVALAAQLTACTKSQETPTKEGFVRADGTGLVLDGRSYRFHGLNYYDINTYAGEDPFHPGTRHLVGCRFHSEVPRIAESLGRIGAAANALRGWFFQPFVTSVPLGGGPSRRDWSVFDRTLAAVRQAHMRIIVTLGDHFGNCERPPNPKSIDWYRFGYKTEVPARQLEPYRSYVADVVTRYRDHPEILAWQLVSEAMIFNKGGKGCDELAAMNALRAFADDVGGLIHSLDHNHLVSLGTGSSGCGIEGPRRAHYAHVFSSPGIDLCEYHDYYEPTHRIPQILAQELDICGSLLEKPLFIGETGIRASDAGQACPAGQFPACRARLLNAKFRAQFRGSSHGYAEDVVGELVWDWCENAWTPCKPTEWDIVPGDPVLLALASLPTS